jgi:hypothetical protein
MGAAYDLRRCDTLLGSPICCRCTQAGLKTS